MSCFIGRSFDRAIITCLLGACIGIWTGCSSTQGAVSHHNQEPKTVFQQLAHLEVSSNCLYQAVTEQADAVGYSRQLELQSDLASPLTPSDRERIKQSFARALKVMVFDLAPTHYWESHLTDYYVSKLQAAEVQALVEGHEKEVLIPSSRLQELRRNFVAERLPDLLPDVRARSRTFQIPDEAMVSALLPGDQVIVNKAAYHAAGPQRGDVIVFRYPNEDGKLFLHRVIGVPGDRVEIRAQVVSVNGEVLMESYVQHTDISIMAGNVRDHLGPVIVPSGAYFVLGDNREESLDSRFLGSIGKESVLGQVVLIYWSVDPGTKTPRWDRLNQPMR
jgi:signal peptidase I